MKSEISGKRQNEKWLPLNILRKEKKNRFYLLDGIRGINLLSMILFHGVWDAVYLLGNDWSWYEGYGAYLWQQSICWIFIFISGFCVNISKGIFKRGLQVFGAGILISAVTMAVLTESRIVFGVLTLLGSAMLITGLCLKGLEKLPCKIGLIVSSLLFIFTKDVNYGFFGFLDIGIFKLPEVLYSGYFSTYLGFSDPSFFSSDYFSLIPWIFLFFAGYFFGRASGIKEKKLGRGGALEKKIPIFSWLGRHSLIIYLLHQPILYLFVMILG